jgi:hypothetical protein
MRICCVTLVLLSLTALLWGEDAKESEKLRELEMRVKALEQRLDSQTRTMESNELAEIRRQVSILAQEIEKLRSGEAEAPLSDEERRSLGFGPSAATVYTKQHGVSFAGYGEMLYENFNGQTEFGSVSRELDQLDFLRAVVYLGYRFNDRILFNSEIEFEHATTGEGGEALGEASVEFAAVDYMVNENLTLRGGLVLVPMGFLNEFHEPTVFLGARRTETETVIIPTTWRENGAGIVGRKGIFDYRAYIITPLNAAGFTSEEGLREGRQEGALAKIPNPALVGRLDLYPHPGLLLGGSLYGGKAGLFGELFQPELEFRTIIGDVHAEYRYRGWDFRTLYAQASVDNVAQLNASLELTGSNSIGKSLNGAYIQAGYNFLAGDPNKAFTPYIRFETVNTQKEVPAGFLKNPATDRRIWTFGAEFRPIYNLVIKADYEDFHNEVNSGIDQFNIALGYSF